ncbi:hypothetical protein [Lysobacter gummosus]|uniref:hypothetical protein n=1 Tax=Lysobacter gummosus TaxID=262324 RepID=UPI003639D8EF
MDSPSRLAPCLEHGSARGLDAAEIREGCIADPMHVRRQDRSRCAASPSRRGHLPV